MVEAMLKTDKDKAAEIFVQVHHWLARAPDKNSVADFLIELTHPYPEIPEGHLVVAQSALAAKREALALSEAREAVKLRPDWDGAVVFEAQMLMGSEPDKALSKVKHYLDDHADNQEVRLFYARALLEQKHYIESRNEFQRLQNVHPENGDLAFAVALISLELGEFDRAEKELKQALAVGKKDESTVHYYLAQLSEAKKDDSEALVQYAQVIKGEYVYASRLREVYLLNKAGKLNEARDVLHRTTAQNDEQRVNLLLIESQMLREAKQYAETFAVLTKGLEKHSDHPALLYEAAMAADKIGKPQDFEKLLRKLLKVAPDNAHAYNALGYSYLEHKVHIEEGMKLVERAYQLAPDDAAITDSMGWGNFLLGNVSKSIEFLRRAFAANPDPEIAAHLGEALWTQGGKEEARKIWQDSLKSSPDSEVLRSVIKRFIP
jgi:tetratricopeptide (TPR) repeat protein